jgi:hypothetical protein
MLKMGNQRWCTSVRFRGSINIYNDLSKNQSLVLVHFVINSSILLGIVTVCVATDKKNQSTSTYALDLINNDLNSFSFNIVIAKHTLVVIHTCNYCKVQLIMSNLLCLKF